MEISHISVSSVPRSLLILEIFRDIFKCTVDINHLNVHSVPRPLLGLIFLRNIFGYTVKKV